MPEQSGSVDVEFELLSQYVDGELSPDEARRIEERLQSDSGLRSMVLRLERLNGIMREASPGQVRIPETVVGLLHTHEKTREKPELRGAPGAPQRVDAPVAKTGNVLEFPGNSGAELRRRPLQRFTRWPTAVAASVALAVAIGPELFRLDRATTTSLPGDDAVVSAALDKQSSSDGWYALGDGRELQPVLTFQSLDGSWCREYLLRGQGSDWRAVACRDDHRWVTRAAGMEDWLNTADAYQPAGAESPASVAVFINNNAAGIALGAEEEAELLANWRR